MHYLFASCCAPRLRFQQLRSSVKWAVHDSALVPQNTGDSLLQVFVKTRSLDVVINLNPPGCHLHAPLRASRFVSSLEALHDLVLN